MQKTAAVVFQGEAGGDGCPCSVVPLLGPSAASVDTLPQWWGPGSTSGYPALSTSLQFSVQDFSSFIESLSAQCSAAVCARQLFGLSFVIRFVQSLIKVTPQTTETLAWLALWYIKRHKGMWLHIFAGFPRGAHDVKKGCGRGTKITFSK